MRTAPLVLALPVLALLTATPFAASAQDATTAGEARAPHPTLEHISISWEIEGDANEDGVVTVRFREEGAPSWRVGLPLSRVPAGSNPEGFSWGNRHAGSLFGLRPDTAYEIELTLTDTDGGSEMRSLLARTRPVPTVPDDARIVDATPETIGAAIGGATPGDVIRLAAGTYPSLTFGVSGSPDAPIVLRGSDVEDVIIDGELRMDNRSHIWIEDLTVRGQIKFNSATGIVVRGCHVEAMTATGDGIVSMGGGSTDGYFADNVVIGRSTWAEASLGAGGDNIGDGFLMSGVGNVIEHNRVIGFRDCIALQDGGIGPDQFSIDILRNDLDTCADDAIEVDFTLGNVRVIQNRIVNSFIALSSQPSLGGPTYFIRNVIYNNVFHVFKPLRGSVGDYWFHNTVVKAGDALGVVTEVTWSRMTSRNNLFIGGGSGATYNGYATGPGRVMHLVALDEATADFDYDGFGSIGTGTFRGRFGATTFESLAALRTSTTEANAVEVDLSVFAAEVVFPDSPFPGRSHPDLRLTDGAAVDVGEVLPNINDGYVGLAPDIGAYELGTELPPYGPRSGEPVCGNGVIEEGETCDDGNTIPGDGCDENCQIEHDDDGGPPTLDGGGPSDVDGGVSGDGDGGPRADASAIDGGSTPDEVSEGCGCRTAAGSGRASGLVLLLAALFAFGRRRRAR